MKESVLNNIERIVKYMDDIGWMDKVELLSPIDEERKAYCEAIAKAFLDLSVESLCVAEAKYHGYVELVKNKDNPEVLDSIMKKHMELIAKSEAKRKDVEDRISEAIFLLEEFRERVIEMGNLPQTVPADDIGKKQDKECA